MHTNTLEHSWPTVFAVPWETQVPFAWSGREGALKGEWWAGASEAVLQHIPQTDGRTPEQASDNCEHFRTSQVSGMWPRASSASTAFGMSCCEAPVPDRGCAGPRVHCPTRQRLCWPQGLFLSVHFLKPPLNYTAKASWKQRSRVLTASAWKHRRGSGQVTKRSYSVGSLWRIPGEACT